MVKVATYTKTGSKRETETQLAKAVFEVEPNHQLLSQAYKSYLASARAVSASTLTRGLVRGGGKKPWRQKGTGRARVGSIRVPNWRGGGVIFGPSGQENYLINMPVKMKRQAICQALSLQAKSKQLIVIEDFISAQGKVKQSAELFSKLKVTGNIVLVVPEKTALIDRATRNLPGVTTTSATYLNVYMLMNADWIIVTEGTLETISGWLTPVSSSTKEPVAKESADKAGDKS